MTVKELIEQLQTLDPKLRVFTEGYEGGYGDACIRDGIYDFNLNHYSEWYYGPHEIISADNKSGTIKGIILNSEK
jgi:hypothetical protein